MEEINLTFDIKRYAHSKNVLKTCICLLDKKL